MARTILEVLKDEVNIQLASARDANNSGVAKDYPEYRDSCGFIRGLSVALREIEILEKNTQEYEDD